MSWQQRMKRILFALVAGLILVVGPATTASAQVVPGSHYHVFFQNRLNGLCMEVGWSRTDPGFPVGQYPCWWGGTQSWEYNDYTGLIMNENSGLCMAWASDTNFAPVIQVDCNSNNTQWQMNHELGFLFPAIPGEDKCLEVPYSTSAWNAPLGIYHCWGGANQQWNWNDNNG